MPRLSSACCKAFTQAAQVILAVGLAAALLSGCAPAAKQEDLSTDPRASAAAEATRIVALAQATALVMQAQSQANALIQAQSTLPPNPTGSPKPGQAAGSATPSSASSVTPSSPSGAATPAPDVQVVSVNLAIETGLISVQYRALPEIARTWYEGIVYVVDESSGVKYSQIPIAGPLGPLLGIPPRAGQPSYIMFVNSPPELQQGASVTVVLGNFKIEHILVK
jgi:hypothetical protein